MQSFIAMDPDVGRQDTSKYGDAQEQNLKTLGLRTYRNKIAWATVEGDRRLSAVVTDHGMLQIPSGERGEQLAWVRREIIAINAQEQPDSVVLCPTEGTSVSSALVERSQVDGVVVEALYGHFANERGLTG